MTARPIRRNAQTPDRNGKIFYTSTTSLSHISKRLREVAAAAQHRQQHSEKEVADLQAELREERNFSFQQRAHISVLESRCRKAEKLLKMLPPEVVWEVERREKQAERLSR